MLVGGHSTRVLSPSGQNSSCASGCKPLSIRLSVCATLLCLGFSGQSSLLFVLRLSLNGDGVEQFENRYITEIQFLVLFYTKFHELSLKIARNPVAACSPPTIPSPTCLLQSPPQLSGRGSTKPGHRRMRGGREICVHTES